MNCPDCDFESVSSRLVEVHWHATHGQEMLMSIAEFILEAETQARKERLKQLEAACVASLEEKES